MPRLLLLGALHSLGRDGAPYRELKASMPNMPDGVLFANLNILEQMGYIKREEITYAGKTMTAFHITKEGDDEFQKARDWLKQWIEG